MSSSGSMASGNLERQVTLILLCSVALGCSLAAQNPRVRIHTSMGELEVELFPHSAPVTAGNFLALVEKDTYTGSTFYRVVRPDNQPGDRVKIQVIQGGLFSDSLIDTHDPIIHEPTSRTGILHTTGVISMARNQPGSASTEFFICIGDQPSLDFGGMRNPDEQGFAAFGRIVKGMNVVRAIQRLPDHEQMLLEPVVIYRMERVE